MKKLFVFFVFYILSNVVVGQAFSSWLLDANIGTCSYNGDLVQGESPFQRLKFAAGVNIHYRYNAHFNLRAGLNYGFIFGEDRLNSDPELQQRNLSFYSHLFELSTGLQYNLRQLETLDEYSIPATPYIFAGAGLFHFDPYTYDNNNNKVFLQPLHTEGQGLSKYPDRTPYSLYQFCIPFGGGVTFKLSSNLYLSYEFTYHILFTDYLDDVSKTYVSLVDLKNNFGQASADLSFRQDGVPFSRRLGEIRGDKKDRDVYYFNLIKLSFFLDDPTYYY